MSLITLPTINCKTMPDAEWALSDKLKAHWRPELQAKASESTISIYDVIGDSWDGEGVTAKRISAALRAIGDKPVQVNINSPGGDFFEGVSIYNLLAQHPAKVTVNVIGLAASAASIIAMAGDEIRMGDGAFIMIHNAWSIALGNRHDLAKAAEQLAPFDAEMANIYSRRTGQDCELITAMMDAESWINSDEALDKGFSTGHLSDDVELVAADAAEAKPIAIIEDALRDKGYTRAQRRSLLARLHSKPSAAVSTKPSASDETVAALQKLITILETKK